MLLNLVFLLSIVLLPVTNGLYGNYDGSSAVAVLYGLHLSIIAGLNAWLWWLVMRGFRSQLIAALFPLAALLPGTAVAAYAPQYASYFWFLAFGGLLIRRRLDTAMPARPDVAARSIIPWSLARRTHRRARKA
ncbi:hypothetical protein SAMN05216525_10798 [Bradyrhizobium sp. Gha]|nr:hypothetical protein SAMN05216525_10798 [Bradyrhizobium sp. Gha]